MAELVDALVSGTSVRKYVQVRVLFWALNKPLGVSPGGFLFKYLSFSTDIWVCKKLKTIQMKVPVLLGGIAGDVIGSKYESFNTRRTDFRLFGRWSRFTDDTVLTVAIADALMSGVPYEVRLRSEERRVGKECRLRWVQYY